MKFNQFGANSEYDEDHVPTYDSFGHEIEDEDENVTAEDPDFDAEKASNVKAAQSMQGRRKHLAPYIEKFIGRLKAVFNGNPEPADLYTALELLYDWTLDKIESSMNSTYSEASQWLRVANDLIELDEYALMESVDALMIGSPHSDIRSKLEVEYNNLLKDASGSYENQAKIFLEIGFALTAIVEEQINANPDDAEDYIELKETLDRKYGPLFTGLERQVNDMASVDRRYGRATAR